MNIMGFFNKSTKDIPPICGVDLDRYLGTWYEIIRLPHRFEDGLENVTATYKLRNDGKIEVNNAGVKNGEKKTARAVAWVPDKSCSGILYVSFFPPIKAEYKIILLDEKEYQYAVVTGSKRNYLWILSRKPEISSKLYNDLIEFVSSKGFDITKIIRVKQA